MGCGGVGVLLRPGRGRFRVPGVRRPSGQCAGAERVCILRHGPRHVGQAGSGVGRVLNGLCIIHPLTGHLRLSLHERPNRGLIQLDLIVGVDLSMPEVITDLHIRCNGITRRDRELVKMKQARGKCFMFVPMLMDLAVHHECLFLTAHIRHVRTHALNKTRSIV